MPRAASPCDVAVVGGGIVGAAAAYELARLGVDVVLVDGALPGRASDAGAGILSPETLRDPDDQLFELARAAGAHYRSLVDHLAADGEEVTGFAECGLLSVALHPGEDPWFAEGAALFQRRARGLPPSAAVVEIDPSDARDRFPPLGPVHRAMFSPTAARVDGRQMTAALLGAAGRRGVRHVRATARGFATAHGGTRVTAVDTDGGTVGCGSVVLAAGSWTAALTRGLGVAVPVTPLKGQIVHLRTAPANGTPAGPPVADWPIVQPVVNFYLVPWPDGRVACGGTLEAEAGYDTAPTAGGMRDLLRECVAIAPGLADAAFAEVRVGLRPRSPDDRPVLGPLPGWDNVHVATGHGTEGLLLGPYSAALVATAVHDGALPVELAPFGAGRLSR